MSATRLVYISLERKNKQISFSLRRYGETAKCFRAVQNWPWKHCLPVSSFKVEQLVLNSMENSCWKAEPFHVTSRNNVVSIICAYAPQHLSASETLSLLLSTCRYIYLVVTASDYSYSYYNLQLLPLNNCIKISGQLLKANVTEPSYYL